MPGARQYPDDKGVTSGSPPLLCPAFQVPEGRVCQLFAPLDGLQARQDPVELSGQDGVVVLRIEFRESPPERPSDWSIPALGVSVGSPAAMRMQVHLQLPSGETLATCRMDVAGTFAIHTHTGERYADLSLGLGHDYVRMHISQGPWLDFRGHLKDHEINASDNADQVKGNCSVAEVGGDRTPRFQGIVRFTLAPGVDVGLLVLGMMCANLLAT